MPDSTTPALDEYITALHNFIDLLDKPVPPAQKDQHAQQLGHASEQVKRAGADLGLT